MTATSEHRYLNVHTNDGVTHCVLGNPPTHTLVAAEVEELRELVAALEADGATRVLVFTGAGEGVFIRHYEVGELAAGAAQARDGAEAPREPAALHAMHQLCLALEAAPFVTVAAINGSTAGGGLEFALACDFRLAMHGEFSLGLPETSVGIIPGAGGTQRLTRLLGTAQALDLILHARLLDPDDALNLGLVTHVYPKDRFQHHVEAFARDLASRAPVALAAAKRAIQYGSRLPLEEGLALEQDQFERCMRSEDADNALRAHLAGEAISWKGR